MANMAVDNALGLNVVKIGFTPFDGCVKNGSRCDKDVA